MAIGQDADEGEKTSATVTVDGDQGVWHSGLATERAHSCLCGSQLSHSVLVAFSPAFTSRAHPLPQLIHMSSAFAALGIQARQEVRMLICALLPPDTIAYVTINHPLNISSGALPAQFTLTQRAHTRTLTSLHRSSASFVIARLSTRAPSLQISMIYRRTVERETMKRF